MKKYALAIALALVSACSHVEEEKTKEESINKQDKSNAILLGIVRANGGCADKPRKRE